MPTASAMPSEREALLGASAERIGIGLMAARTAAVLRRLLADTELDHADRAVINEAIEILSSAADAVESVEAGSPPTRRPRSLGFGAMALAVELAAPSVPTAELPRFLQKLVIALEKVRDGSDREAAELLLPAFSTLADVATQQAGTVGESTTTWH